MSNNTPMGASHLLDAMKGIQTEKFGLEKIRAAQFLHLLIVFNQLFPGSIINDPAFDQCFVNDICQPLIFREFLKAHIEKIQDENKNKMDVIEKMLTYL